MDKNEKVSDPHGLIALFKALGWAAVYIFLATVLVVASIFHPDNGAH